MAIPLRTLSKQTAGLVLLILLAAPLLPGATAHEGDQAEEDHMQGWSHTWMALTMVFGVFIFLFLALLLGYMLGRNRREPVAPASFYKHLGSEDSGGPPES